MKTPKTTEAMVEEFEEDFRDYLNASIAYAEIQEPYQALSSEDEIKWLKKRVTQLANSIHEQSALEAEGRKTIIEDLMNKIDTLVGYLEVPELPEQTVRLGIIEEWEDYKREAK